MDLSFKVLLIKLNNFIIILEFELSNKIFIDRRNKMLMILTNPRLNKHLPLLICILIFPLTIFLTGCYTTRTEMVTEEQLPGKKNYEIISLFMKDGEIISLEGKEVKFFLKYKNLENVICYQTCDTIKTSGENSKIVYKDHIFAAKDIKFAKIEISKLNVGMTILITTGVVLLALVIILIIAVGKIDPNAPSSLGGNP